MCAGLSCDPLPGSLDHTPRSPPPRGGERIRGSRTPVLAGRRSPSPFAWFRSRMVEAPASTPAVTRALKSQGLDSDRHHHRVGTTRQSSWARSPASADHISGACLRLDSGTSLLRERKPNRFHCFGPGLPEPRTLFRDLRTENPELRTLDPQSNRTGGHFLFTTRRGCASADGKCDGTTAQTSASEHKPPY